MVVTLIFSCVLGGLLGLGLGLYLSLGLVLSVLCYMIGGILMAMACMTVIVTRQNKRPVPIATPAHKATPQLGS